MAELAPLPAERYVLGQVIPPQLMVCTVQ